MPIEILMPALSPTMKEGNLAKWIKKEGDKIEAGEVIAEIETDKATMEVEAGDEGILGKILIQEGTENVAVNECIGLILEEGEDKKSLDSYKPATSSSSKSAEKSEEKQENPKKEEPKKAESKPQSNSSTPAKSAPENSKIAKFSDQVKASPLAKRIAKEENVSLYQIANGTGPNGRIVKDDIIDFLKSGGSTKGIVRRNSQEFTSVKNSNIRKVIAKRLLESKQTVPHFYLSCELKIDKLLEARATINSLAPQNEEGKPAYKVSVNDMIIKATAMALKKVPEANSSWNE
jgi:pyruvate dehydrogenase E2 component (dihydrolipoamide acetyltransferase)